MKERRAKGEKPEVSEASAPEIEETPVAETTPDTPVATPETPVVTPEAPETADPTDDKPSDDSGSTEGDS